MLLRFDLMTCIDARRLCTPPQDRKHYPCWEHRGLGLDGEVRGSKEEPANIGVRLPWSVCSLCSLYEPEIVLLQWIDVLNYRCVGLSCSGVSLLSIRPEGVG
jgi:hypothetical protein